MMHFYYFLTGTPANTVLFIFFGSIIVGGIILLLEKECGIYIQVWLIIIGVFKETIFVLHLLHIREKDKTVKNSKAIYVLKYCKTIGVLVLIPLVILGNIFLYFNHSKCRESDKKKGHEKNREAFVIVYTVIIDIFAVIFWFRGFLSCYIKHGGRNKVAAEQYKNVPTENAEKVNENNDEFIQINTKKLDDIACDENSMNKVDS